MVDLSRLSSAEKSTEGVRMNLLDPETDEVLTHQDKGDKSPREMYLVLLGPDSNTSRRAMAKIVNREKRRKKNHIPNDAEIQKETESDCKMLASITTGGLVFYEGKWVDVNSDNAMGIYLNVLIVRSQALQWAFDVVNFTKG